MVLRTASKPRSGSADEFLHTIDTNATTYITLLSDLIRAASPNPPGDTTAAVNVIRNFLTDTFGITTRVVAPLAHAPNLLASFQGGAGAGPGVILNGHVDTYPARAATDDDDWDPYSGRVSRGKVHGRGAVDMKAGTAALAVAFGLLYERRAELEGRVGLMCVSDEETGGKWGSRWLLEHGEDGVSGLEGGEKSPWEGDVMLNSEPGGVQSVRFGEKGTLRLTFKIRTRGANGAYTFRSEGAIRIAARLIGTLVERVERLRPAQLDENLRRYLESEEVKKVADEIMGKGAGENLLVPTVNIGTIKGGLKVNMVPEECLFEADIRLPVGMLAEEVLLEIDSILKTGFPQATVEKQEAASNPANVCTIDHPMAGHMIDAVKRVTKRSPVMLTGLGGTDCKFWRYRNVPAYTFGPSPGGMGSSEEAVSVEEFKTTIKAHMLAVWEYLGPS